MKPSEIKTRNRHRIQMGDIDGLATSIKEVGLLHPIVVDGSGNLVAGERRLEAIRKLGWPDVPVTVANNLSDVHKALIAERDENTCRLEFSPTEMVSMARALEPFEKKAAEERQAKAGPKQGRGSKPTGVEKFSEPVKGRAADKVASAVGVSRPTLTKAKAVVEAAEREPEKYGDLPKKMDEKKKVDPVYKEMVQRQAREGLPQTKTPHQQAAEDASRRWAKSMHDVFVLLNSTRNAGGITSLVREWNVEQRAYYAEQIKSTVKELSAWLAELQAPIKGVA